MLLLRELATPTSPGVTRLWPMAPPFVPSDATVGVVGGGEALGTGDAPGGRIDGSHNTATRPAVRGKEKPFW